MATPKITLADYYKRPVKIETWLAFLDREVLTIFDIGTQLTWAGNRILDEADERKLGRWRQADVGPSRSVASHFLYQSGVSFREYEQFCRDRHLQPFDGVKVPLDWFCGWL